MFGMTPSDDPVKSAMMMAGLSMLTSNGSPEALNQLPQMIMQAKQLKAEQDMKKRQLAIQEAGLDMDREKLSIYRDENSRAQAKQRDATELGKMFASFDLNPSTAGNYPMPGGMVAGGSGVKKDVRTSTDDWSGADMVNQVGKADAAMPYGTEGNPMAKQLMALPAPIRAAMAKSPLASGEMMAPALTQKMTDVLDVPGAAGTEKAPQVKTFTNQKGETLTLDMNNDQDYQTFQGLDKSAWVEAPTKTLEKASTNPVMAPYETAVADAQTASINADDLSEKYSALGSLLLRPDIYTGAGAPLVNGLLSSAQDVFGVLPEVDFSTVENADKSRRDIVLSLRASYPKDPQMSNADRQYYQGLVVGEENKPKTVARAIAVKQLSAEVTKAKAEFLMQATQERGLNAYQAIQEWNKKAKSVRETIASEDHINEVVKGLLKGSNDTNLVDYVKKLSIGKAVEKIEGDVGMSGETEAPVLTTPPPLEAREKDKVYQTPSGPMKWTGTGWIPAAQQ